MSSYKHVNNIHNMNDTDNIIESLLLAIQLQLSVLHANQEQIKMDINSLGNEIMIKESPKQNLSLFINISPDVIKIGHPLQESVISGKAVKGGNLQLCLIQ
ncbi:hypothetical protein PHYBLDRAFT_68359 [Phycomyces blakesleeanus NRRL 1555(-)]|uniref:Uncharacterized protein n=1 Tax=Phycomyces blakesleeanus (strain ATCC 8743b / DSM 1359 / FGSC 10004 / NBRC 33097 / NRRL 1555) TaxID=763407 RepID=A0A163D183_PHYB8|nr:hypothetical protein PHYBLDRAFT_68359 [Phycomyces blakesleeanus NRRL 1555(-)]OAD67990.1 hypothetical protein PHYBLDRAFT_68359 [Phycomyces blakesleeanus NRRL 1555(-)]|eukprot:XP_018286030.1 hypothetical protein PHYBLDRAFT_68359 [Phycomyces blakesleeanus NRRL 1555(-)]